MVKGPTATLSVTKSGGFGPFYAKFLEQWLPEITTILNSVILVPYNWQTAVAGQNYGYQSSIGLYGGGAIESSPQVGQGSPTIAFILADNNHEGAAATDYLSSQYGNVKTQILQNVRLQYASPNWFQCGACTARPLVNVTYPQPGNKGSFGGFINRWEAALGNTSPYYDDLISGFFNVGGIGNSCGTQGQTVWQLANGNATTILDPPMVTVMPGNAVPSQGGITQIETVVFQQMVEFLRQSPTWKADVQSTINLYSQLASTPPRAAYHWVRLMLLTAAWSTSMWNFTPPAGVSSVSQALTNVITQIFTSTSSTGPLQVLGAYGGTRGMSQNWGTPDHRPEANMQTMGFFDPNGPAGFGTNNAS